MTAPRYLVVAQIVAPFGVDGEMKADLQTDFPKRLAKRKVVYLGKEDEEPLPHPVERVRFHGNRALLKLADCRDRDTAETLRGLLVQVPLDEAPPAPPGSYYIHQIVGLNVFDIDGAPLGAVASVIEGVANDVYVVKGPRGELLVPAAGDFVTEVDVAAGRMVVDAARL